jgi:hypothetical protein
VTVEVSECAQRSEHATAYALVSAGFGEGDGVHCHDPGMALVALGQPQGDDQAQALRLLHQVLCEFPIGIAVSVRSRAGGVMPDHYPAVARQSTTRVQLM